MKRFSLSPWLTVVLLFAPPHCPRAQAAELAKLNASDAASGDLFGIRVNISDDLLVIAAPGKDVVGSSSGAAYIFQWNTSDPVDWLEVVRLTPDDAQDGDLFGGSVAITGDSVIVGAPSDDEGALGSGSAYIFDRHAGGINSWGQVKKLLAPNGGELDFFGANVDISGDTAIVGAQNRDVLRTNDGAAYIFQRNFGGTDNWGEIVRLTASESHGSAFFGGAVALSGDWAVVGASRDANEGIRSGTAYVFHRDQGGENNWGEVAKLTASDPEQGEQFGNAVGIDGDTIIVGARQDNDDVGAGYVFQRNFGGENKWGQVAKMVASDAQIDDRLGGEVAISGDIVILGPATFHVDNIPIIYAFERNQGGPNNWGELTKIISSDAIKGDAFGKSLAFDDGLLAVGAAGNDGACPDFSSCNSGAVYVFQVPEPSTFALAGIALFALLLFRRRFRAV